eukprot:1146761-Rhodomonas_salina.2
MAADVYNGGGLEPELDERCGSMGGRRQVVVAAAVVEQSLLYHVTRIRAGTWGSRGHWPRVCTLAPRWQAAARRRIKAEHAHSQYNWYQKRGVFHLISRPSRGVDAEEKRPALGEDGRGS